MREDVIRDFICNGKHMVVVKLEHGVHVMPYEEWKSVYGKLHLERWDNGKISRKTA